jgi:uncharacterized circularly permuted ATP-grasp superfamily protein/uncharacterized alpha-E superfamily protein
MVDGQGGVRPHWRQLVSTFSSLGQGGLAEHGRRLDAAFDDEGVSGILPGNGRQSWRCDPIPLPIMATEFAALTEGLAQRAELLEAVLQDLYSNQSLLADGLLPPAVVYANYGFLRPCHMGPLKPGHRFLDFYAADLIRGPDGAWRVLADRTSGAAGIAYARENRRVLARVVPEAFRGLQVRQLRPFFDIWQTSLQRMGQERAYGGRLQQSWLGQGPGNQGLVNQSQYSSLVQPQARSAPAPVGPGIALLTSGTGHLHWFEHMMLSRELSCALVEGADLTVRNGSVFLKTLKGLQPVDVLLRRVDSQMLDPLELDAASHQGVPGLMDAARAGTVRISNDPGAGAMEAPALAAWLPALAMRLLGEPLKIASVPTLWLGEPQAQEMVWRNPERWLIREAADGRPPAIEPAKLGGDARRTLLDDIARQPWRFAATTALAPSVAPCSGPTGMVPRPVVLRVYMVFDGQDWHAMEGGLARVMEADEKICGALPGEGLSKDVWVLHDERSDIVGPPAMPVMPVAVRRTSGDLPSRVADDLFWLGRYVERLEGSARLVRATVGRLSRGVVMPREMVELEALSRSLAKAGLIPAEAVTVAGGGVALSQALLASVYEGSKPPGSVAGLIVDVAHLTELVRDRLTGDMYSVFTSALRQIRADSRKVNHSLDGLLLVMTDILRFSASFAGLAAENMVRGGGWMFLELGRRMERAQAIASQVGFALEQPPARVEPALRLVLELCDSLITYRTRYLTVLQPLPVLDLVLADTGNPRGLAFQLSAIGSLLDEVAGIPESLLSGVAAALLDETLAMVQQVADAADQAVAASDLPKTLHELSSGIGALSDRVGRYYFALLPVAQTLGMGEEALSFRGAA